MNTSEASEFNVTSLSPTEATLLWSTLSTGPTTTTTTLSPSTPLPPDAYDPQLTIMVVLGLSLLLAGLAAFLAVCRPGGEEGDTEGGCGRGDDHGALSSEPQLKVWKRLGSYRRTHNMASFRRPQHRRPHCEREQPPASQSAARQTLQQPEAAGVEPHLTTPCLFDYVTEI